MANATGSAFDFTLDRLEGGSLPLAQYRGHPLLIANTASRCGFTPQYAGLQELHQRFGSRGLVVLGVPSNDFGGQEPGSPEEIAAFCERNYGVGFPMAGKAAVRGEAAHPLFAWLAEQGGALSRPRWNFYKYLIGADGRLLAWFTSITGPKSHRLVAAVEKALRAAAA